MNDRIEQVRNERWDGASEDELYGANNGMEQTMDEMEQSME